MNVVAAVFADFVEAPAGGPSQLLTPVADQPVLARTLRRVAQIEGLRQRCLVVRPRDQEAAAAALRESGVADSFELLASDTVPRPRRVLLTTARKWNLESWRGGLLGSTWFDEYVEPAAAALVLRHYRCDAVFCFDGHQPVLDPGIATAMLQHADASQQRSKLTFTQTPPGLAGVVLRDEALHDLLEWQIPVGLALSYRPELAQTDPIVHEACFHVAPEVAQTAARFTGDTRRSRELLEMALRELGDDVSAMRLCEWIRAPGHDRAGPLPVEIELELTTGDPLPRSKLRPRGQRVPGRELQAADVEALRRVAHELAEYDDRLVYLGGHGDPLAHPEFARVCHELRAAGVYGLAVGTPLVNLGEEQVSALFEHQVDVVEVFLDAHDPETYSRVQGDQAFDRVRENIRRLEQRRRQSSAPRPIVVCSLTRCADTIHDQDEFYDHWILETGAAVIRRYNDYGGLLAPDSLLPSWPAEPGPCRRLATHLVLLADGRATFCDQDVSGAEQIADWRRERMRDIWRRQSERVRERSLQGGVGPLAKCFTCAQASRA